MTNALTVCLFSLLFYCTNLAVARQVPKECSKGPGYWCQSLKVASDCGAVGHCISTVWETQDIEINNNEISDKFIRLFKQLKDVKDLINEDYLATRVSSACRDIHYPPISKICKDNTAHLETYLNHVLVSKSSPGTICRVIGMCNNMKLDNVIALNKKKTPEPNKVKDHLIGSSRCTWGPSYWCSNFSTGHECKATKHCIERVWSKMTVPEDKDDICKICTDMVKQARDQLQSNETQEELKKVFEGSCDLIPLKIVRKECKKISDEFVPELVETLASEMNPQTVCSVAGLCNNAMIDKLLLEYNNYKKLWQECNDCQTTVGVLRKRFESSTDEDFLVGILKVCGKMGSLSDSCSMLVFKYYENIKEAVKKDLTPQGVCHINGQCNFKFHRHADFDIPVVKYEELKATDDVPCEFCEKLVVHLRDVLVSNTTELQFLKVLKGFCKSTGTFKDECLDIVKEYYPVIYNYLTSELKPKELCSMMGICGPSADVPVSVLLPRELAVKAITPSSKLIGQDEANSYKNDQIYHVPLTNKQKNVKILDVEEVSPIPLPIERMFVSVPQTQNNNVCSFCEYFLHYLQVELSDTANQDKIEQIVDKACDKLPESINGECKQFVSQYGPAVIALLVQRVDPATVCPALGLCPKTPEVTINVDKSNCPLCLFAIEELETMIKKNPTEQAIRVALSKLCHHTPQKIRHECSDFVEKYSEKIIEMLVARMNAQQICEKLHLCKDKLTDPLNITHSSIDKYHEKPMLRADRNNYRKTSLLPKHMLVKDHDDIETNEIPDDTVNGRPVKNYQQKTVCVMCEFVMKEIDDEIKDKNNEDEIKKIVHNVCRRMPKSVRGECDQFVEKYADLVISLLAQELEPTQVCQQLKLCDPSGINRVKVEEILDCAVCETVVMAVKKVLSNDKVDHNIVHIVEKSCGLLPAKYYARCQTLMEIYGDSVIHLVEEYGTKGVCQKIGLCAPHGGYVRMDRGH